MLFFQILRSKKEKFRRTDSNTTPSTDQKNIYKTCDNCLITIEKGQFIERPEEMIPATRKQVDYLLEN